MVIQFAKWGNSLALRIPAAFARDIGASEGGCADISMEDGKLIVTPVDFPMYDLDELLAGMPKEKQDETSWGESVGNEFW